MKQNLEIADAIDSNPLHQTYDEYCKKILRNKQILAHIMKACISEYRNIPLSEIPSYIEHDPSLNASMNQEMNMITGRNNEDQSVFGAETRYDIVLDAKLPNTKEEETIGLFINLEAQNSIYTPYPLLSRAVYYGSRLLSKQKNEKGGFCHSDFKALKKVYSIWIVMNVPKAMEGVWNQYTIQEECIKTAYHFKQEDYDKLAIVIICPKRNYDVNDEEHSFMELLHILFKAKMSSEEKKRQLSENYGIRMTRNTDKEVETMCNLSRGFVEEGLAIGKREERIHNTILNVKNLMETMHICVDKALELLKISEDLCPIVKEELS